MINYNEFTTICKAICGDKISKLLNIASEEILGVISREEADLKRDAVMIDAYLCPTWDYLKYPEIDLYKNKYSNSFTNEQFESVGEDEYGDDILIYVRRHSL